MRLIIKAVVAVVLVVGQAFPVLSESSCSPEEACCYRFLPGNAAGTQAAATVSWTQNCLRSLRTLPGIGNITLEVLLNGHLQLYSYTDLLKDTRNTNSSLARRFSDKIKVHDMKVDLPALVREAHALSIVNKSYVTSRNFDPEIPGANLEIPEDNILEVPFYHDSYLFHFALTAAFNAAGDGHTTYKTPFGNWSVARDVMPWPAVDAGGRQVYKLHRTTAWRRIRSFTSLYQQTHGEPLPSARRHEGKIIVSVNGEPVEQYMRSWSNDLGMAKSAGQRLNKLLQFAGSGIQSYGSMVPPKSGEDTFVFSDGTSATWKLTVIYSADNVQSMDHSRLEKYVNDASVYLSLLESTVVLLRLSANIFKLYPEVLETNNKRKLLLTNNVNDRLNLTSFKWKRRAAQAHVLVDYFARHPEALQMSWDPEIPVSPLPPIDHAHQQKGSAEQAPRRRLAAGGRSVELLEASASPGGTVYAASYDIGGGTLVYKMNTFAQAGVTPQDFWMGLGRAFVAAVMRAKQTGAENLILDLSANNGGYVSFVYYMLRLMNSGWSGWQERCTDLRDFRHNKVLDFFSRNFGEGWGKRLMKEIDMTPDDDIVAEDALSVVLLVESLNELRKVLIQDNLDLVDQDLTERFRQAAERCRSQASNPSQSCSGADLKRTIRRFVEIISSSSLLGGSSGMALYPIIIDGEMPIDPATGEPYDPLLGVYNNNTQWLSRGGVTSQYTQRYALETCKAGPLDRYMGIPLHSFKKVVLLTDGTCASACSQFASRLMTEGLVRTVSYGGFVGEDMDTSAYAGGNVIDFEAFWRQLVFTNFAGFILNQNLDGKVEQNSLPLPLPSPARSRFNFNEAYSGPLGPNALPREFYVLPADVHLPFWLEFPGAAPSTQYPNEGLIQVWFEAAKEFLRAPELIQETAQGPGVNGAAASPSSLSEPLEPGSAAFSGFFSTVATLAKGIRPPMGLMDEEADTQGLIYGEPDVMAIQQPLPEEEEVATSPSSGAIASSSSLMAFISRGSGHSGMAIFLLALVIWLLEALLVDAASPW